jgi:hypothetical protein
MIDFFTDFKGLLPPILMSFGIFPLLFRFPFLVPKADLRHFLIVFNLILVWMGYITTRLLSDYLFYPSLFTIGTFFIGILLSVYIIYIHQISEHKTIKLKNFKIILNYSAILLFVTMGFTNYSANQNKIVILAKTVKPVYSLVIELKKTDENGKKYLDSKTLHIRHVPFYHGYVGSVIDQEQFDKAEKIVIYYLDENKKRHSKTEKIETMNIREVGMGGEYVIDL